jgi:carbonic anhydrase
MERLISGIRDFRENIFPLRRAQFEELASGQQPSALFITCSDSRIVPELLTQTGPGELFVLRNAGNLVPPCPGESSGEAATIEYAVRVLKVQDVIVCGHSHCGAISALLRPELRQGLPAVDKWLIHAERVWQEIEGKNLIADREDDLLTTAVKANALVQLDHLRRFAAVAEAEACGALRLHACFYRFETGEFLAFNVAANRFTCVLHELQSESSIA